MLDRDDGKLLKAFGSGDTAKQSHISRAKPAAYHNMELRIRSVFAKGDSVVLSGSESVKGDRSAQAHIFAWDVLSGDVIASIPAGERVKAVSCVAWNEKGKSWAGGCSDGMYFPFWQWLNASPVHICLVLRLTNWDVTGTVKVYR
jgi:mitogen-activated protein kinase organizer 1